MPEEQLKPRKNTVGAALSVGCKHPDKGYPIHKDRFYVVETETQENRSKVEIRPPDPRFQSYTDLPVEQRRKFYGMVAHHRVEEFFDIGYLAYRGPSNRTDVTNPKHRGPWCHGDGHTAERWNGEKYVVIDCPGEACAYRQVMRDARGRPWTPDKPVARFYFLPRWPQLLGPWAQSAERPLMKLVSRGRLARETFAGMLEDVRSLAEPLGIEIRSWFGLPWTVSLGERTNQAERHRYPVLTFALDGDPLAWIKWQAERFQGLLDAPAVLALGAASEEEQEAETVGADIESVSAGPATKPALVSAPEPEVVVDVEPVEDDGPGSDLDVAAAAVAALPMTADEAAPETIGEAGKAKLEKHVATKRAKAAPRAFPAGLGVIIAEAGIKGGILAEDLTRAQAAQVSRHVNKVARQMPRDKA